MAYLQDLEVIVTSTDGTQRRRLPRQNIGVPSWKIGRYGGFLDGQVPTTLNYTLWAVTPAVLRPIKKGDRVDIKVKGNLVYRGYVTGFERSVDDPKRLTIELYGASMWLRKIAVNRAYAYPAGVRDVAGIFADFAQDWLVKSLGPQGVALIAYVQASTLGVTALGLDARRTISGDVLDTIVKLSGNTCVWGVDVDSVGNNRLYIRPFASSTSPTHVLPVPSRFVKTAQAEEMIADVVTGLFIQGGATQYPQLIHNGNYSLPVTQQTGVGNLILNGDFEAAAANWTAGGAHSGWNSAQIQPPVREVPYTGSLFWNIDSAGGSVSQTVTAAFSVGHVYQLGIRAARAAGNMTNLTGTLSIQWQTAGGANIGAAVTQNITVPDQTYNLYTLQAAAPATAGKAVVTISVSALSPAWPYGGMVIDDVEFFDVSVVYQDGWRLINAPDVTVNAIDWTHPESYAGTFGVLIDTTVTVPDTDFHDAELVSCDGAISFGFPNTPVKKFQVLAGNGYQYELWAKFPASGAVSPHFPDILLAVDWYDQNGNWTGPPVRVAFAYDPTKDYTKWQYYAWSGLAPAFAATGYARCIPRSTGALVVSAQSFRDAQAPPMLNTTTGAVAPYVPEGPLSLTLDCDDPYLQGIYLPAQNGTTSPLPAYTNTSGVANPTVAPTIAATTPSTATPFVGGTYTVSYSYVTATGESLPSPVSTITLQTGQAINVSVLAAPPAGVTSVRYYIGTPPGPNWPRQSLTAVFFSGTNAAGAAITLSALPLCSSYFFARLNWGSMVSSMQNSSILDINGGLAVANQVFSVGSGPAYRPAVQLLNDTRSYWPGDTVSFQGSLGPTLAPVPLPIVQISGTFDKMLKLTIECQREQPDETIVIQQLILRNLRQYGAGGTGFGGGGYGAPSNGQVVGPAGSGGSRFQTDKFGISGLGPYALSQTPAGTMMLVFTDAGFENPSNYTTSGTSFSFVAGYPFSQVSNVWVIYIY